MESFKIKIINKSGNQLPKYSTEMSAGMDIRAYLDREIKLKPLERAVIPTGLYIELPEGFEAQVRPRSGLAAEKGITVLNTPGTIDSDYRGEIKVIIINLSENDFIIKNSDRIAQMVISRYQKIEWELVDSINDTDRGTGGFGHTGKE